MKKFFFIAIAFLFFHVNAQINSRFVIHLAKNNLEKEHAAYLNTFPSSDSLNLFKAKYYLQYGNASGFLQVFPSAQGMLLADTGTINYAAVFFLRQRKEFADAFFSAPYFRSYPAAGASGMRRLYEFVSAPEKADTLLLPQELRQKFAVYKRYYNKKPFVAGLLSAAVPGLGRVYTGRKLSFINTLIIHALFVTTGVEAVSRLGWKHPYTIINLAYSGVFYVANIYASANDVKRVKKEKRKQFLLDAADHFEYNNGGSLYPSR